MFGNSSVPANDSSSSSVGIIAAYDGEGVHMIRVVVNSLLTPSSSSFFSH